MPLLSSAAVLRLVDSMAIVLSQAYQLARARLASAASPIVRLLVQRDQAFGTPRFVITDHGTQFRRQFRSAMKKMGIIPVQARVRAPYLNGKIERACATGCTAGGPGRIHLSEIPRYHRPEAC